MVPEEESDVGDLKKAFEQVFGEDSIGKVTPKDAQELMKYADFLCDMVSLPGDMFLAKWYNYMEGLAENGNTETFSEVPDGA